MSIETAYRNVSFADIRLLATKPVPQPAVRVEGSRRFQQTADNGSERSANLVGSEQAEPLLRRTRHIPNRAKQVTENVLPFGDFFRLLMSFLTPGHPASFLGLTHAVPDEHHAIMDNQKSGYSRRDPRSHTEMVRAQHEANKDEDKPLERGMSGETAA